MTGSARVATERLRGVLDAVATMSSDLSLEGLLDRILREAGALVGAERGFLDVLDRSTDRRIGTFASYGIDAAVEPQQAGRQLLVELLEQPDPRLGGGDDVRQRSSFIGVPIKIQDRLFGNLYLIGEQSGSGFSREDEEIAIAMASAAGVVIENARLYEEGKRQRRWLEAAAEITTALLSPIARLSALQLVADRARYVASADFVAILMPVDEKALVVEAVSGVPVDGVLGEQIDAGRSIAGDAARLRQTVVVSNTDLEPRYEPHMTRSWPDLGSLMALPLHGGDETGALIVGWLRGHETDHWELDPVVPQRFADQAALVLQVAHAQADQARLAVFVDRDRIGRDLHDLVIQRLFGIGLMLDNTTKLITSPPAVERLSSAIDDIDQTIKDIRRTIFALSSADGSNTLRFELEQVLHHSSKLLGFKPELRLQGPVDSVITDDVREQLIAVLGETMSNIVRHAHAGHVVVQLDVDRDITLVVTDDGDGIAAGKPGNGLRNIRDRAVMLAGSCTIDSQQGAGTTLTWTVPRRAS
jgi:signal transduction histidine kinase